MKFARLLARPRYWPYYKVQLASLEFSGEFAHSWVMRIPVCLLSSISCLTLKRVDWATTIPHPQHFLRLSHCKDSMRSLKLYRCRFRNALDLRRMINALPNLSEANLDEITFQHPSPPRTYLALPTVKMSHHQLSRMILWGGDVGRDASNSDASGHVRRQDFLNLCSVYPAINDLTLSLRHFTSFPEIEDYLQRFRNLSSLSMHQAFSYERYPGLKPAPVDVAPGMHTPPPPQYSLSRFELHNVSLRCALQLLTLVSPRMCYKLRKLVIKLVDRPCAELIAEVTSILQSSGAAFEEFDWDTPLGVAVPRLSANTSLKSLYIRLLLPSSPQIIQRTLEALLSDITSPHLRRISLDIGLRRSEILQDAYEVPASSTDTTETIPTFHTILCRDIYSRLPKNGVKIEFDLPWGRRKPKDKHAMSGIKSHMLALFAPWLDRGILEHKFDPDPDITAQWYTC